MALSASPCCISFRASANSGGTAAGMGDSTGGACCATPLTENGNKTAPERQYRKRRRLRIPCIPRIKAQKLRTLSSRRGAHFSRSLFEKGRGGGGGATPRGRPGL